VSYKEARDLYQERHGKTVKNPWIAHIKNDHGKTSSQSPKRKGDYKYPCPDDVRPKLEKILKDLKMI
jgi:hypothetical protein